MKRIVLSAGEAESIKTIPRYIRMITVVREMPALKLASSLQWPAMKQIREVDPMTGIRMILVVQDEPRKINIPRSIKVMMPSVKTSPCLMVFIFEGEYLSLQYFYHDYRKKSIWGILF